MNTRLSMRLAEMAVLGSTALLAGLLLTTSFPRQGLGEDALWISHHLSASETLSVQKLARQIHELDGQADGATRELLERQATALSIRESAALGILLSRRSRIDPVPWLRLAARREQEARKRLMALYSRFESHEPDYPGLRVAVRGPEWLRQRCGEELLTEVTGAGFWGFYDSFIPAETNFCDADVDLLLEFPGLESIWAESSRLSDAGVARLVTMRRLCEYHLGGCSRLTDAALRAVARRDLRSLDVSRVAQVSDGGVKALANCPQLEDLRLSETGITSASLETICRLRSLRTLALDKTRVREGLQQLQTLDQLHTLQLSALGSVDEPIPSASLLFLSRLKQLRNLNLSEMAVHRVVLEDLPELEQLSLGHVALKELSLRRLPGIKELRTGFPNFRQDIHLKIIELNRLENLTRLTLHCQSAAASDGLATDLATLPSLSELYLPVVTMTDRLAESLGRHPALTRLMLESSAISDSQAVSIMRAPRLKGIDCGGQKLSDVGLLAIAKDERLETLKLRGLRHADPSCLSSAPSLKSLTLNEPDIGILTLFRNSTITRFEVVLGRIGGLRFQECPELATLAVRSAAVENLTVDSCPRLQSLFAGGARLGTVLLNNLPMLEGFTIQEHAVLGELSLAELPALRSCTFWAATIGLQPLETLVGIPTLVNLDVSATSLADDGAEIISRMAGLKQLTASSRFSRAGLKHLQRLHGLQRLLLYRRDDADWTEAEAQTMFANVREFVVFDSGKY